MTICDNCRESGEAQAKAMEPREPREGLAILVKRDALGSVGNNPVPDVRMGDVVKVQLIAAAVPDMNWCSDPDCENYEGARL